MDENSKRDWDPISKWLQKLRFLGVAVILVHHTSKGGDQRGTGARVDNLDCTIILSRPSGWNPLSGAQFEVSINKPRNIAPTEKSAKFTLTVVQREDGKIVWTSREKPLKEKAAKRKRQIVELLMNPRLNQKEIAEKIGVTPTYVTKWKKTCVRKGVMDNKRIPTEKGEILLKKIMAKKKLAA
jgi:hypothetical protein